MTEGFLLIDKPSGMTSHDVVNFVRKRFKMRRVGHAGTLDPLATGILIILLGKHTKLFQKFSSFSKAYSAVMTLGITTTTADVNGKVISEKPYGSVNKNRIEDTFKKFIGDIDQIPPMVSAIKVNGKRLYSLARKGIEVKRRPRKVRIDSLRLTGFNPPDVSCDIECSKGTYIRKIAEDVGELLGCGACISKIRRTKVGPFEINDSVLLDNISETNVRHWKA